MWTWFSSMWGYLDLSNGQASNGGHCHVFFVQLPLASRLRQVSLHHCICSTRDVWRWASSSGRGLASAALSFFFFWQPFEANCLKPGTSCRCSCNWSVRHLVQGGKWMASVFRIWWLWLPCTSWCIMRRFLGSFCEDCLWGQAPLAGQPWQKRWSWKRTHLLFGTQSWCTRTAKVLHEILKHRLRQDCSRWASSSQCGFAFASREWESLTATITLGPWLIDDSVEVWQLVWSFEAVPGARYGRKVTGDDVSHPYASLHPKWQCSWGRPQSHFKCCWYWGIGSFVSCFSLSSVQLLLWLRLCLQPSRIRTRNGTSVLLFGLRSAQLWMSSYHNKTQCVSEPGEVPSPHCAIALDWLDWSATLPFRPVNTEGKFAADPSTAAPVGNLVTVAIFLCCFSGLVYPLTSTRISAVAVQCSVALHSKFMSWIPSVSVEAAPCLSGPCLRFFGWLLAGWLWT